MTTQEDIFQQVLRHQDALISYAYAISRDWNLAEDAVQEALMAANKGANTFREGMNVYAWARGIVRNKALDEMRAFRREQPVGSDELSELVDRAFEKHLTEEFSRSLDPRKQALRGCMATLETDDVALLNGFYRENQSCSVLAFVRQKTENAIRLRLSKLRKQLRSCVSRRLTMTGVG